MSNEKLETDLNPDLVVSEDNKPRWYLPKTRREGYRNLHKINRYGLLFRSDLVLRLNKKLAIILCALSLACGSKLVTHKSFSL